MVLQVRSPALPSRKQIHYFQNPCQELMAPAEAKVTIEKGKKVLVSWHTAYGDEAAIDHYEIRRDGVKVENIPFTPQTIKTPHTFTGKFAKTMPKQYVVKVIDKMNKVAETIPLLA